MQNNRYIAYLRFCTVIYHNCLFLSNLLTYQNVLYIHVFSVCLFTLSYSLQFGKYHNYDQLTNRLESLNSKYPELSHIYTLDKKSVEGRKLQVIQVGPHAKSNSRPLLVPMMKYVANMHGNEVIGREIMIILTQYLLEEYKNGNKRIIKLLNETDLHIMPTMNPDGFERSTKGVCRGYSHNSGRTNHHGVDLNRDFPDWDFQNEERYVKIFKM